MTDYWFARYKPATTSQRAGRGLVPLNWKGRATIAAFVLAMVGGGALFLFFGLREQFFPGIACFAISAIAGASFFIWAGVSKADPVKSAYDYLAERKR
jgi:hypothetical protein